LRLQLKGCNAPAGASENAKNGFSNSALALQLGVPISGLVTAGW
jgi:hypothetical protein